MKKNIMIVGASGYGNVGDDAYKYLLAKHLNEYELWFDSPYPDTSYADKMDMLIVGGGGLIYDDESGHFQYMKQYMEAMADKPMAFISVGVQCRMELYWTFTDDNRIEKVKDTLVRWKPYIDRAVFVGVRSLFDNEVLTALSDNPNINYYPDVCYSIEPVNFHLTGEVDTLFIPRSDSCWNDEFVELIKNDNQENSYLIALSRVDEQAIDFMRRRLTPHENYRTRLNIKAHEAMAIMRDSKKIITCRYHGLVLGFASGKSYDDIKALPISSKIIHEPKYGSQTIARMGALEQIEVLKQKIKEAIK